MKKLSYLYLASLLIVGASCEQELVDATTQPCPSDDPSIICPEVYEPCPAGASAGSASFTKFVAVGNSFVAGVQGGALFTDGQNNSLAAIVNKQLECVGSPATFVQPTIGATLGWNLFITQPKLTNPAAPALGRMLLQYAGATPDCATGATSPRPTPQAYPADNVEAVPNPTVNPGFIYGGGKATLQNFGVPALFLGQAFLTQTGNWAAPTHPYFNPFYARLAFPPTGSTLIGDVQAAQASFVLFYLGLDDFLLHAAFGADAARAPLTPASGAGANGFDMQYGGAIASILGANANTKMVVGNFPDIWKMPHFTSVKYNPIPMDAPTAATVGGAFAGFNAALDGLIAHPGVPAPLKTELATRKINFTASCNNAMVINDEYVTDLGPYFDILLGAGAINATQRAQLAPYENARQTTAADIIPLGAGAVIGTTVGGNPLMVNGVSVPLADQYVITPTEKTAIDNARAAYNATVSAVATANTARVALADIDAAFSAFTTAGATIGNNITLTPNINPPTGIYSEDGIHPNTRGYAFMANIFIDAINAKFGATIPKANYAMYGATALPIP